MNDNIDGHPTDPIPGPVWHLDNLGDIDDLVTRIPNEVATANHVFDTLRGATTRDLEQHRSTVERLTTALPHALSYRLLSLEGAKAPVDAATSDRQRFWCQIHDQRELDYLETLLQL